MGQQMGLGGGGQPARATSIFTTRMNRHAPNMTLTLVRDRNLESGVTLDPAPDQLGRLFDGWAIFGLHPIEEIRQGLAAPEQGDCGELSEPTATPAIGPRGASRDLVSLDGVPGGRSSTALRFSRASSRFRLSGERRRGGSVVMNGWEPGHLRRGRSSGDRRSSGSQGLPWSRLSIASRADCGRPS